MSQYPNRDNPAGTRATAQHLGPHPMRIRTRWAATVVAIFGLLATVALVGLQPQSAAATTTSVLRGAIPATKDDPDRRAVELGVRFRASKQIVVTGLRFYRGPLTRGPFVGRIWTADGEVVRQTRFPAGSGAGWVEASLAKPLTVDAGTPLIASYVAPSGRYAADQRGFRSAKSDGVVTYPKHAGVYNYSVGELPTETWHDSNYYVDVVYHLAPSTPAPPTGTATPAPSPTPVPSVTPTAPPTGTPTPTPTNPASGKVLDLPQEAWWGGPAYYSRFAKASQAGWTSPDFFPIAVFYGKPEHAAQLKALGVNTYMGAEHDGSKISVITGTGISVIAQDEWSSKEVGSDPRVVGWHISDECDMGLSGCDSPIGEAGSLIIQSGYAAAARAKNDGRFVQANFGNGVLGTYWSTTTMPQHLSLVDVSSVDKYAYTSPVVQDLLEGSPSWPNGAKPASSAAYGWLEDRMETFMVPNASKPNWVFVETAMPNLAEAGARDITGAQISGAVWNAIIHGAAGIAYFQHNNDGKCGTYSLIDCGSSVSKPVADVDAQVRSLAPVINSPSYQWSFGSHLQTALKVHDGSAYILAMTDGATGTQTFTLPSGLTGKVEVVGENRSLAVTGGRFTDSFASESSHHVYRITLG